MASVSSSREARRRKIIERGSDRLAFITGQLQSVPPPPPLITAHSPESLDSPEEYRQPLLSKQSEDVSPSEESASAAVLPNQDITPQHENDNPLLEQQIRNEAIHGASVETSSRREISSMAEQPSNPHKNLSKSFSPSQVTSAIASSERIRLLCSTIAGLVVVLWSVGFPFISSSAFSSLLMMKPFYVVLLTNVTIVVSLLIVGKSMSSVKTARVETMNPPSGTDWVSQIGTSLEIGLMMMNAMDAVVMDFSLYAVVVVCGVLLVGGVFF